MQGQKLPEDQIRTFWKWFCSVSSELGDDFSNEEILKELNSRVTSLGDITWELGPGTSKPNALTISPGGNRALLPTTERIVAFAPRNETWEWHAAKPPKDWNMSFVIKNAQGTNLDVNARQWRYILCKLPDGTFDISVQTLNLPDDDNMRFRAAYIAIEAALGEYAILKHIRDIEAVSEFEGDSSGRGIDFTKLPEHFASLTRT